MYGTSKTDKDLVFSSASLEALEQCLPPNEQQLYPLVMRPGMPLPQTHSNSSQVHDGSSSSNKQALTWRRYFHSQLAAVYSGLFTMKVPRVAAGAGGPTAAPVEHDFVFTR